MTLEDLGREVRRAQDEELDPKRRRVVRDRLLTEEPAPRTGRIGLALAAVVAAAGAVWVTWPAPTDVPLEFSVAGEPGRAEAFVSAATNALDLTFSDGSTVALTEGSSARVDALTPRGAVLRLEHGRANVEVVHRDETDWKVQAGPYTVHVVGTRFAVAWDARSGAFEVAMREGHVVVDGPTGFRTELHGDETLRREGSPTAVSEPLPETQTEPTIETARAADPVAAAASPSASPSPSPSPSRSVPVSPSPSPSPSASPTSPSWQTHARNGHYDEVAAALDAAALDALLASGSTDELTLAGTSLRRARDPREARVWEAVRGRFAGTNAGADAAFHLGRHAFHSGSLADSERWLRTYLREAPEGRWSMEARGRLLEVVVRRQPERAAEVADAYLTRYPDGPHAALARAHR